MLPNGIREITSEKGKVCREVLDDLPDWFGIPEAVDAYVRDSENLPMFGLVHDGAVVGFVSLKLHTAFAAEAYVLGVKRGWHRRGIGRRLLEDAESFARGRGCVFLTVKTLAPDRPSNAYARTRRFYDAMGFLPVELFPDLWGPENPCLFMIKALAG